MRFSFKIYWLLVAVLIKSFLTAAQETPYIFRHITAENGLINNKVLGLCQDSEGYIWIGTIDGLQRYDGSRFVNYLPDLQDPEALHTGGIYTVFEDSKNRLWVGGGAPYQLNRHTGKFYNYNLHLPKGRAAMIVVTKFMEDKKGGIWMLCQNGFYKLNDKTNQFEDFGSITNISSSSFSRFMEMDRSGNMWLVTTTGITCYNASSGAVNDKRNNPAKLAIFNFDKRVAAFKVSGDDIFISTIGDRAIYKYGFSNNQFTIHRIDNIARVDSRSNEADSKIDRFYPLKNEKIALVLTGEGIALFDAKTNTFTETGIHNNDPNGLHSALEMFGNVAIFEDREQNIWISTERGINIFNPDKKHFNFYGSESYQGKSDLPAYVVNGLITDTASGDIFIGYYHPGGGVIRLSKDLTFKRHYLFSENGTSVLAENQVWCLFQDKDGIIWAPNQAKSILRIDPKQDRLTLVNDSSLYANISVMKQEKNGDIWLGTWANGLQKIDHQTKSVTRYMQQGQGAFGNPKNVLSLYSEGDSIIWVGSNENGFYRFDKRTEKYTASYRFNENNPSSISSDIILKILPYKNDTLILATAMGLHFFNKKTGTFGHLTAKDGLPGNTVQTIQLDELDNLWAACDGGFCKVNMHTRFITRYGLEDGLTSDIFSNADFLKIQDGRFLVSAIKGFFAFKPSDISVEQQPPTPVITGFKVFDAYVRIDAFVNTGKALILPYNENNIAVEFASLQYNTSNKLKFYYRLEGVDTGWNISDGAQPIHYNQLDHGKYFFRIKCTNRDGLGSQGETTFHIAIGPPYWHTWWFRGLLLLVFTTSMYVLYQWQKKRRQEKERVRFNYEKKIAAMEMNTLRAQMNPHFIFNSLNSINTFILKNDGENAMDYLQKFSSLVRLILNNSRSEWILLEDEIRALTLYIELESIRFENLFTFNIDVDGDINTASVRVPPLIIQPYVENAIRHGIINRKKPGGKIDIRIWKEADELYMEVTDNGIGRQAAEAMKSKINKLHQPSYGMKISAERLSVINDVYKVNACVSITDVLDENLMVGGTKVLLTIQFRNHEGHYN